jgi:protein gp37
MAETNIEWADYTFNPWRGCSKVSPGCANCCAEKLSKRNPEVLGEWGPKGRRSIAAESYWKLPMKWERKAKKAAARKRVFCLSMGDVCDDRPELIEPRERLKGMIAQTPNLDWLLLSKRPENYARLFGWGDSWPRNVWLGTSVENQEEADKRIPHLLACPAAVRFLSVEPMLGPVDLTRIDWAYGENEFTIPAGRRLQKRFIHALRGYCNDGGQTKIDWVICGGESGPNARPMHPDWARSLRDQCVAARVPFFFKQWGEWAAETAIGATKLQAMTLKKMKVLDGRLAGQAFHSGYWEDKTVMLRVGKARAGRLLDGREWNEYPRID